MTLENQWVLKRNEKGALIDEYLSGSHMVRMLGLGFPKAETVLMPFLHIDQVFYLLEDQVTYVSGPISPPYIRTTADVFF